MKSSCDIFCLNPPGELSNLKRLYDQQEAKLDVVNSNFTQTVQNLRDELETAVKDRTRLNGEVVELRRHNTFLREQHALYTRYVCVACATETT